ncbi:MAG TPA: Rrf2 family transcriptional regulator [Anaerolineales bacterium]
MLRINRQTDYAIRFILALAKHSERKRISSAEIQQEMLIPAAFSPRIVAELARGGFIATFPGRDGGLELARPANQINLREVVEYFEGPISVSDCISGKVQCPFDKKCPVRRRWGKLQVTIVHELEAIAFDELAQDALETDMISLPIFTYSE